MTARVSALDHANRIIENSQTTLPLTSAVVELNNKVADYVSKNPMTMGLLFNGAGLAAAYQYSSGTVFSFLATWQVASTALSLATHCLIKGRSLLSDKDATEMRTLVNEIAKRSPADIFTFLEEDLANSPPSTVRSICSSLREAIAASPPTKRMIYAIRQKDRIAGYLIGTCHAHSKAVALDPILHDTVRKCGVLISEGGTPNLANLVYRIGSDPLRYHMDAELTLTAIRQNLTIKALETVSAQAGHYRTLAGQTTRHKSTLPPHEKALWMQVAYLNADTQFMSGMIGPNPSGAIKTLLTDRNKQWLLQLTPHLNDPEDPNGKPICIAVGCLHCVGPDGLVSQLQAQGFTVTPLEA